MPVLSCLELNAAGVDIGATEIYIEHEAQYHQQIEASLRRHARGQGFELTPKQTSTM
jgi:hypothetical protein